MTAERPQVRSRLIRTLGSWKRPDEPLFRSLAAALRTQIRRGEIVSGQKLPSERLLAQTLGVSRTTVVAAFTVLRAEGLVSSRPGSGTRVSRAGIHRTARGDGRLAGLAPAPGSVALLDLGSADMPALDMVAEEIRRVGDGVERLLRTPDGTQAGLPELREAIAAYYGDLGVPTEPSEILVTSGAHQGLRLVASTLLEPGRTILVEDPTFGGAIESLRALGLKLASIPSGPAGMDTASLAESFATHRPHAVYAQPSGNNPVGSVLDRVGRERLARQVAESGALLVDDGALADTVFDAPVLPPLAALVPGTITLGSASKLFWGRLRIGWIRADAETIAHLALAKTSDDLGTSFLTQHVAAALLTRAEEARTIRREQLRAARDRLLSRLDEGLPEWRPVVPRAGASAWVRLPGRASAVPFAQVAARAGVRVYPGSVFSADEGGDDHLRIGYTADPDTLDAGIRILEDLWRRREGRE